MVCLFGFKMKEKGKTKSLVVVLILVLVGVLAVFGLNTAKDMFSSAAGGAEPTGVKVDAKDNSATISWTTEKDVMAVLQYGTTPASLLLRALETTPGATHRVAISPLKSGTTYYFNIRVGDDIFDNGGIPYSFKTMAGGETVPAAGGALEDMVPGEATAAPTKAQQATAAPTKAATGDKCGFLKEYYGDTDSEYDYNADGKVNVLDFVICQDCQKILNNMGSSDAEYDKNGDGRVNMPDYVQCLSGS